MILGREEGVGIQLPWKPPPPAQITMYQNLYTPTLPPWLAHSLASFFLLLLCLPHRNALIHWFSHQHEIWHLIYIPYMQITVPSPDPVTGLCIMADSSPQDHRLNTSIVEVTKAPSTAKIYNGRISWHIPPMLPIVSNHKDIYHVVSSA